MGVVKTDWEENYDTNILKKAKRISYWDYTIVTAYFKTSNERIIVKKEKIYIKNLNYLLINYYNRSYSS